MPFNGSGGFSRLMNWVNDATAGVKIRADRHDTEDDNFAAGLSQTITKDGQTTITANIPFNAKRITSLADPVNDQDAATKKWIETNVVGGAHIADTPPVAKSGQLWWDSGGENAGNLFLRVDDGSSSQWIQVNIAPPVPRLASPFKRTIFTASTTAFQFDPATLAADIEVVGAGGGGGSSIGPTSGAGLAVAGGGGGGGGYSKKLIEVTAAVRAATKTISIGAAASGGNGSNSSYGDTINALVGGGGNVGTSASAWGAMANHYAGGLGGTASGGDLGITGTPGEPGSCFGASVNGVAGASSGFGGTGGHSVIGGSGGRGAIAGAVTGIQSLQGNNALYNGCGGGGSLGLNNASNPASSTGGPGLVIITEYR